MRGSGALDGLEALARAVNHQARREELSVQLIVEIKALDVLRAEVFAFDAALIDKWMRVL